MQMPYTDALDSLSNDDLKKMGRMLKLIFSALESEPALLSTVWRILNGITELAEDPLADEKVVICAQVIDDYNELCDRINNLAQGRISRLN